MKYIWSALLIALVLVSCKRQEEVFPYSVSGRVVSSTGEGLEGIRTYFNESEYVETDVDGNWFISNLTGANTIRPVDDAYTFTPAEVEVREIASGILFAVAPPEDSSANDRETPILNWLLQQQLPNGLLESTENGNVVSLYDQALAALAFIMTGEIDRAERIFDFFQARIDSELKAGVGGFSQFRDRNGTPGGHRWMGDNAWLLIALNNYEATTGKTDYNQLSVALSDWLISLQDSDGGLFAGYGSDNQLLSYKVTEGNIDAFNAIKGYNGFHTSLLQFLETRWDATDKNLMAWPSNPEYRFALDNFSWSYCIFEDYPVASLHAASRFLTTQTATLTGAQVEGYDIDEDRDAVFLEGSGQMALAWRLAGLEVQANYYLAEMEKAMVESPTWSGSFGFPYATNPGTTYGNTPFWQGADTEIAISSGAWYLYALNGFNPFAVERAKNVPLEDRFWLD